MVRPFLLDVNVLVAMAWPSHVHHHDAQAWFGAHSSSGFRTCPLTQAGFVRLSSNPRFSSAAVSPRDALRLLERITSLPGHEFWPDNLPLSEAYGRCAFASHRQVTDAYLLSLAASNGGVLATLDRGLLSLATQSESLVELVQGS